MNTLHGYPKTTFFDLTVQEMKNTNKVICEIEAKDYFEKGDFQTWENHKKDAVRLQNDLIELGLKDFILPLTDYTNRVGVMRYCNNNLSYGISTANEKFVYFLCESPILSSIVLSIISEHKTMDDLIEAFYNAKKKLM